MKNLTAVMFAFLFVLGTAGPCAAQPDTETATSTAATPTATAATPTATNPTATAATPTATNPTATATAAKPTATATATTPTATAATATAATPVTPALCLVEAWSTDRSWWGNRDLAVRGPGALGAEWSTSAIDDAGVIQHVIICGRPFRVLEENVLFSRVLWSSDWEQNDRTTAARDRKIQVTVDRLTHDRAMSILGVSLEDYIREMRKLSAKLDSVEVEDQPES